MRQSIYFTHGAMIANVPLTIGFEISVQSVIILQCMTKGHPKHAAGGILNEHGLDQTEIT